MSLTITGLEKGVRVFAEQLKRKGFVIDEIDSFRDGTKGGEYGGSWVELSISVGDYGMDYTFKPKYGLNLTREFNDTLWSEQKANCLLQIECDFKNKFPL